MFVRNLPYRITSSIVRKQEDSCPVATEDIQVNLTNRQNAIDNVGYGPMNPAEPNVEFWDDKAERWNITPDEAKTALCGNCVFFIRTPSMLECISGGLGESEDIELVIDAGELGYCQALDFKCASERTCNAWAAGGPITEEDEVLPNQKNKLSSNSILSSIDDLSKMNCDHDKKMNCDHD